MFQDFKPRVGHFLADDAVFYSLLIILVAITSFGLGKRSVEPVSFSASVQKESPIQLIQEGQEGSVIQANSGPSEEEPTFVGSKNGTKYHALWCPGASQIKEENKIYFASKEEAQKLGYTPASNCKGMEAS